MKKAILIFTLTFVLAFSFVTAAPAGNSLSRILQKGELVVGITGTQPPLNATTKDGKIIGFDAEIATTIAMNMGVKVKIF